MKPRTDRKPLSVDAKVVLSVLVVVAVGIGILLLPIEPIWQLILGVAGTIVWLTWFVVTIDREGDWL